MKASIPAAALRSIEARLHALIRETAATYRIAALPQLPSLTDASRSPGTRHEFVVPGMYGGFSYGFDDAAPEPTLIAESWSRVVEGSGMRHAITASSTTLLDRGFV